MPQLPVLSGLKLVKAVSKLGYRVVRQRGSHMRLAAANRKSVTVPAYKSIDRSLVIKILRDAEISVDDFIGLL